MKVRIAIHQRSGSFSDRWIEYCEQNGIDFYSVDCYRSDILQQLRSANVLLWHWHHAVMKDVLAAPRVIKAAEMQGLTVFPNSATCWHFDDKVAQKYLLEAVDAPLVPTHVFYDLQSAMEWIDETGFPKVFKLSRGAGSSNVRLVKSAYEARHLARKAFSSGFKPVASYFGDVTTKLAKARRTGQILAKLKRLPSSLISTMLQNTRMVREKGYFYMQDFMPDNSYDTRVTIIGDRAFAFTRNVRKDDFRASGSGSISYDLNRIDMRCVQIAFGVAGKIGSQSLAFDFMTGPDKTPRIGEVSYGYLAGAVHECTGYWDSTLQWHEGNVWPQDAILSDLLKLKQRCEK